jgi:hypothetical protein
VEAIKFFTANMGPRRDLIYTNGSGGNLAALPIKSLRKKVIMVFDEKAFPAHITPGEGIHRFKKHPASGVAKLPSGLCTCGEFSASAIFGKMSMSAVRKQAGRQPCRHKTWQHGTAPALHLLAADRGSPHLEERRADDDGEGRSACEAPAVHAADVRRGPGERRQAAGEHRFARLRHHGDLHRDHRLESRLFTRHFSARPAWVDSLKMEFCRCR